MEATPPGREADGIHGPPSRAPVDEGPAGSRWLRPLADGCLRVLIVGVALVALLYVAAVLRLVALPLALAVVLATLLHPLARSLSARGLGDGRPPSRCC